MVHSTEAAVLCFMDEMHAITSYLPFSGSNELGLKTALWVLSVLPKNTQLTLEPRLLHDSANVAILQKKLLNTIILQYWIKIQCHAKTTTQYAGLEIKKKPLGRLLATNWRNTVARCKFSVASLYNQNNFQVPLVESVWYRLAWRGTHSYNKYFLTYLSISF